MLGDMFNKNNRRKVITREGQILYMGKKYAREKLKDGRLGYYVCTSGNRARLHVVVWEHKWGREVPAGCVVHHLDWNKSNNAAENLICVTVEEHERIHNIVGGAEGKALGYELIKTRTIDGLPPNII